MNDLEAATHNSNEASAFFRPVALPAKPQQVVHSAEAKKVVLRGGTSGDAVIRHLDGALEAINFVLGDLGGSEISSRIVDVPMEPPAPLPSRSHTAVPTSKPRSSGSGSGSSGDGTSSCQRSRREARALRRTCAPPAFLTQAAADWGVAADTSDVVAPGAIQTLPRP